MLITRGCESGKTSAFFNLILYQQDIDKIYLYAKDLDEPKYQLLVKKREDVGMKHLNDQMTFIEYSSTMDGASNNIDDYNPKRYRKVLIVFYDMIADISTNKQFQGIFKELFIRCRKILF